MAGWHVADTETLNHCLGAICRNISHGYTKFNLQCQSVLLYVVASGYTVFV